MSNKLKIFLIAFLAILPIACGNSSDETTTKSVPTTAKEITDKDIIVEEKPSGDPVTTIKGGSGSIALYKGFLGTLSLDEKVVDKKINAPVTESGKFPLTGTKGENKNRVAAVVKIDNSPAAIPQTGLDKADILFEEPVEGGITRIAAVFHSQSTIVGPVRSARTTDIGIINSFNNPLYLYSGANTVTDSLIRKQAIQNRSAATSSGYYRDNSKKAPSNLYTDLSRHWASADKGNPKSQFSYRKSDEASTGTSQSTININYRSNKVVWSWNGSTYLRSQNGSPHKMKSGKQLSVNNIVVVQTEEKDTGLVDSSGAQVPEYIFVGTNKATIFSDGKKVEGTWTRPSLAEAAVFTDNSGKIIRLTPGTTWVQISPENRNVLN